MSEHREQSDEPTEAKPVEPAPSDEELEQQPEPGQEEVPDEHIMSPEDADADDTVDDKEDDTGGADPVPS